MKKILLLFLLVLGVNISLAGTFYDGNETSFGDITLDEGSSKIGPHASKYFKVWGEGTINDSNKSQYITPGLTSKAPASFPLSSGFPSSLKITCKNGKITEVKSVSNTNTNTEYDSLTGNVESIKITYGTGGGADNVESYFTATCKNITNPIKELSKNTIDINYKTISINENNPFETLHIATTTYPEITSTEVKEKLEAGKDVDNQPSFVDVLFLQLKTISNLSDIALTQNSDLLFTGLFQKQTDFEDYNKWLDKFSAFSTKKEFQDAFSGAISLKDIGIANDVIKGLYSCVNTNNCNGIIMFSYSLTNKYENYSFDEIEQSLYAGTNNILDASINYYSGLQDICTPNNIDNITDDFLKTQVQSICDKLFLTQTDVNNSELYDLGYSLGVRVKNLQNIKDGIGPKGLNLKGIFNIYWELNNLTLGAAKTKKIEKVIQEPSLTGKYESLKEVFGKDIEELEKEKIEDTTKTIEEIQKRQTILKALTPGDTIYEAIKSQGKENIDLLDNNNYQVTNGVVELKDVLVNNDTNQLEIDDNDTNQLEIDDNDIISIRLETNQNWPYYYYNDLKVDYNNGDIKNYKKVIVNIYNKKYKLGDEWIYAIGTYIDIDKREDIEKEFNDCYNDEDNWSLFAGWRYLNDDYDECIEEVIKEYDRIEIYMHRWKYYAKFKEGDD